MVSERVSPKSKRKPQTLKRVQTFFESQSNIFKSGGKVVEKLRGLFDETNTAEVNAETIQKARLALKIASDFVTRFKKVRREGQLILAWHGNELDDLTRRKIKSVIEVNSEVIEWIAGNRKANEVKLRDLQAGLRRERILRDASLE